MPLASRYIWSLCHLKAHLHSWQLQAKGRVERANRTLQGRLVKELRLGGISNMQTENEFLLSYTVIHNAKFAKLPFIALFAIYLK